MNAYSAAEGRPGAGPDQVAKGPSPIMAALVSLTSLSIAFATFPQLDINVSKVFWDQAHGFVLSQNGFLVALRDVNRLLPWFILLPMALMLMIPQFVPISRNLPPPHQLLYVISFYTVGPGLTVHAIKMLVGRARPNAVEEFSGTATFTPPWAVTNQCLHSCSFISGEAATAFGILTLVVILKPRYRAMFLTIAAIAAAAASINRVALGAHYLSDVVLAWSVMWLLAVLMWRWTVRYAPYIDAVFVRRSS